MSRKGKKVLIVDDDEKNLKLLRILIQNAGHETIEAKNGEEAVRLAKEHVPALILMDNRMPVTCLFKRSFEKGEGDPG